MILYLNQENTLNSSRLFSTWTTVKDYMLWKYEREHYSYKRQKNPELKRKEAQQTAFITFTDFCQKFFGDIKNKWLYINADSKQGFREIKIGEFMNKMK